MPATPKRPVKVEIGADTKGVERGVKDAERALRGLQRDQAKAARAAARDAQRLQQRMLAGASSANKAAGGVVGSILFGAAGVAGAVGLGSMVSDVFDFEKELTRFQIDAQLSASKVAEFREEVTDTSSKLGVSRLAILEGAHAYQILTGDAEGAVEASKLFAEVANASGSDMKEIAAVAAGLKQNLAIDPKDFRAGFDVLLSMGHKGSIELRDMAGELATLAPLMSKFKGGTGVQGLTELDAAMQVAKKGFADAAETGTGMKSLMIAIEKQSARLEARGVKVFDIDPKTGERVARDFFSIVDAMRAAKLDAKDLISVLGRSEAMRAALQLISEDGNAAMHDFFNTAQASDQVAKDNATYMQSTAGKLGVAWEKVKNGIAQAFTPERIDHFVDAMVKITNLASQFIAWLSGPTTADQANVVAKNLLDEGDQQSVAHAKRILAGQVTDPFELAQLGGGQEAAQAGARKVLEAKGYQRNNLGFYEAKNVGNAYQNALDSGDAAEVLRLLPEIIKARQDAAHARAVGEAVKAALDKVQIVVKIGNDAVANAANDAAVARRRKGQK